MHFLSCAHTQIAHVASALQYADLLFHVGPPVHTQGFPARLCTDKACLCRFQSTPVHTQGVSFHAHLLVRTQGLTALNGLLLTHGSCLSCLLHSWSALSCLFILCRLSVGFAFQRAFCFTASFPIVDGHLGEVSSVFVHFTAATPV